MIDGLELLRMIKDNELKTNTKLKDKLGNKYIYELDNFDDYTLYLVDFEEKTIPDYSLFADNENEFEIIEKEERIDIQNIPEYEPTLPIDADNVIIVGIINRLVKAVKQLDKDVNGNGKD